MEDLKRNIRKLEEKLDRNVQDIINNMNKLHNHEEKINNNALKIKENSYALDILKDYKKESKRLFISMLIILCMWLITFGCLIFALVK